jgi:glycosyltransferase involved in cell wall biosynthesis
MLQNKNIMFIANGGKEWIGGLYYIKNIIYTLIKSNKVSQSTKVYIFAKAENLYMFKSFSKYKNVKIIVYKNNLLNRILKNIFTKFTKNILDLEIYFKMKWLRIDYLYPVNNYPYLFLEDKCVYWIPDFQHIHLPEMFSQQEIDNRNELFKNFAEHHKCLILSSKDAYNDYKNLYPNYLEGVHIISFESDIQDEIKEISNEFEKDVLKKYNLPENFIFLPNQFWKHKNHITAFKAIDYLVNKQGKNIYLVCTGNTKDYRNKDYFEYLKKYITEQKLENSVIILGFISRKEQIALMKVATAILQPSLFEGWGTVVEDAKSLDKKIIMSDLSVHYEQRNDKCILFSRNDEIELGNILINLS